MNNQFAFFGTPCIFNATLVYNKLSIFLNPDKFIYADGRIGTN